MQWLQRLGGTGAGAGRGAPATGTTAHLLDATAASANRLPPFAPPAAGEAREATLIAGAANSTRREAPASGSTAAAAADLTTAFEDTAASGDLGEWQPAEAEAAGDEGLADLAAPAESPAAGAPCHADAEEPAAAESDHPVAAPVSPPAPAASSMAHQVRR